MRIGIWAYHWNEDFMTAPWRALFEIVTALAARNLDDEVICLTKPGVTFDFGNANIRCVELAPGWAGRKQITALDLDVLLENVFPRKLKSLLFRIGLAPEKWVFVHGHGPWELEDVFAGEPLSLRQRIGLRLEKAVVRQACRGYRRFICNSGHTGAFLLEKGLCKNKDEITVVPLGAEVQDFMKRAEALRPPAPKDADRPLTLLHIANSPNLHRKGTHLVVEACKRAMSEGIDFTLTMVGDQALKQGYQEIAQSAGLEARTTFTGTVSRDDLLTLFATHDVLLSPSLHEGFGLHLVEGMAAGTVVVATTVGAIPEVVGDNGLLISRASGAQGVYASIVALAGSDTDWERLKSRGRSRAEVFTWTNSAGALDAAFKARAQI